MEISLSIPLPKTLEHNGYAPADEANFLYNENDFSLSFNKLMSNPDNDADKSASKEVNRSAGVIYPLLPNLWLAARKYCSNQSNSDREKRKQQHREK